MERVKHIPMVCFVEKVDILATLKGHNNQVNATFIASRLTDIAFDVFRQMSINNKKDPAETKTNLLTKREITKKH